MPYHFAQAVLTVLFDGVALLGMTFMLMACGWEATRRQAQALRTLALPATPAPTLNLPVLQSAPQESVEPLALEAMVLEPLDREQPVHIPVRSKVYEYASV